MYNQTIFLIAATIVLIAIASSYTYTYKSANAQSNMTNTTGTATNTTSTTKGCIGGIQNLTVHSNLPRCAIHISK
jgi:hypothetical protein